MRNVTHVPAILKLAEILPQVLLTDVDMRPVDAPLEHGPVAFNAVHASTGLRRILSRAVVHLNVVEPALVNVLVASELVRVDGRVWNDLPKNEVAHRGLVPLAYHPRNQLATALKHTD